MNRWNIPNRLEQAVLTRDTACIYCGIDFSVPVSTRGAKPCPPEDVGGPPGYIEFLEAINDPAHDEHDSMLKWCGGSFEPTSFRLDDTNDRLRQIKL